MVTLPVKLLQVRMPETAIERLNLAAGARGMTQAEYIMALLDLHDGVRELDDNPHSNSGLSVDLILARLSLKTVTR